MNITLLNLDVHVASDEYSCAHANLLILLLCRISWQ